MPGTFRFTKLLNEISTFSTPIRLNLFLGKSLRQICPPRSDHVNENLKNL